MTGLNLHAVDYNKVAGQYYLKGGHILPHHDVYPGSDDGIFQFAGRRFATLILYLETSETGGRTIFPRLGIGVDAKAGDAIFWYNVLTNGDPDPGLIHGGCPVWTGRKTIVTYWIRSFHQEFRKKCPFEQRRWFEFETL